MQRIHKTLAILSFIFIFIISLAGIGLGYKSVYYRTNYGDYSKYESVAVGDVMQAVSEQSTDIPVTRIYSPARGVWVVDWDDGTSKTIHPLTAVPLDSFEKNSIFDTISVIHTNVFLGKIGKYITVISSLFLVIISITGFMRALGKQGGWKSLLKINRRDSITRQLHTIGGVIICVPIIILAGTGFSTGVLYLGNISPELISQGELESDPDSKFVGYNNMESLQNIRLRDVGEITFPFFDDPYDVIAINTAGKNIYFDRGTGEQVGYDELSPFGKIVKTLRVLHTTNENTLWMFVWFVTSIFICILVITGAVILIRRWDRNIYPKHGDVMILYASQNGRTKQFVYALYLAFKKANQQTVGVRLLNDIDKVSTRTKLAIIMTSTYGNGDPPDMAKGVLKKLKTLQPNTPYAVVGFGDKTFTHFCGFAQKVCTVLKDKKAEWIMPPVYIDNASIVAFKDAIHSLGEKLGYVLPLDTAHLIPKTDTYTVTHICKYCNSYGTMAVIKMNPPKKARFQAGDIFGIVYQDSIVRFYSIAFSDDTGVLTLCVRQIGLVSNYLGALQDGDVLQGFIRTNLSFHAPKSTPLILLGIGSGVGPLYGIMSDNAKQDIQAFFGFATPEGNPFPDLQGDTIHIAYSRSKAEDYAHISNKTKTYYGVRIDHAMHENADIINSLMSKGAVIMMCGSKEMEEGIMNTLCAVLDDASILDDANRILKDTY